MWIGMRVLGLGEVKANGKRRFPSGMTNIGANGNGKRNGNGNRDDNGCC
jgi:hypothetical protein